MSMRDLLERLRLWLIKKLGGYDRQQIITTRHYMVRRPVRVKRVVAAISVSYPQVCDLSRAEEAWKCTYRQLAADLARQLIQERAVVIRRTDDIIHGNVVLRASVTVIDGRDAALCYQGEGTL